jgi:putative heme-binding domain-containing protein
LSENARITVLHIDHRAMRKALVASFLVLVEVGCLRAEDSAGVAIFNSNCAVCHGRDGRGGRGPNLRKALRNGSSDSDIEAVIRNGVPGTAMPSFHFEKDELEGLLEYIHSLRQVTLLSQPLEGNAEAGKRLYEAQGCSSCHEIGNHGSALGPSLTRIGASRSYEYLKQSIVDPSADIADEYRAITIETRDGKRYQGIWVNEDSFTVQIRLYDESFLSFEKQNLRREVYAKKSLMPAYHFDEADLNDLLAYLSSLVGKINVTSEPQRRPY